MAEWKLIEDNPPPDDMPVMTKIDDDKGVRNEQRLRYHNNLWWFEDDSMYVYYTPTHWLDTSISTQGKGE